MASVYLLIIYIYSIYNQVSSVIELRFSSVWIISSKDEGYIR